MNEIVTNFLWRFGERFLAQIVTFVVSIILARLLTPEEYGAIALVMIFITIANVFVVSGFGNALIQKKDANNVDFSSVFYLNIIFSLFIYLLLYVLSPSISNFFSNESFTLIIRILSLRIPIAAINSIQQAYVSKNMLFKKFFFSTLCGTIISGVVGCLMAFLGYGIWSLVVQYLLNTVIDTVALWITVRWRPQFVFSYTRVKGLISYGWKLLVSSLIDTCYTQLRSVVIGKKYSAIDLAYYNRGQQFPQLIVININSAISSVLFPVISKVQDDKLTVKNMTRRAVRTSSFIMWPMMIGLVIIARPIVSLVLTDKWLSVVPYIQTWCIAYAFWPMHTANLSAIQAIGRSDVFLKLEILKKIVGTVLLLVSIPFGVYVIAVSMVLSTLTSSFINAYPNKKLFDYGYLDQLKDIIPSFSMSIIMGLIIYPFSFFIKSNILLITVQIIFGGLLYFILSSLLKDESMFFILNIFKNRRRIRKGK